MKTIVFLEAREDTDHPEVEKDFKDAGYNVVMLDELYEHPEKLKQLPEMNPELLFLASTYIYQDEVKMLFKAFEALDWFPTEGVVCFSDEDVFNARPLIRKARETNPEFKTYFPPDSWDNYNMREISWA